MRSLGGLPSGNTASRGPLWSRFGWREMRTTSACFVTAKKGVQSPPGSHQKIGASRRSRAQAACG